MIVKDEENNISHALNSIQTLVDEIIIVDTGSGDKTIQICKKYTDKIYHYKWQDDFAAARNESLKHAAGDWILVLDADEMIYKPDIKRIKKYLSE